MKTAMKNLMLIATVCFILGGVVACNNRNNERSSDTTDKDTNFVDTRRNTGSDTTNYLTSDSADNQGRAVNDSAKH